MNLCKISHIQRSIIKFCLMVITISFCFNTKGQDFHFTQFYANKLYLAPSFAGATAENRFIGNYRNQWLGLSDGKGYVTYAASFDHYFSAFNSGLGLLLMRDVSGSLQMGVFHIGVAYSFDFLLNNEIHIRPGASFGYRQLSIDMSKAKYSQDESGPSVPIVPNSTLGNIGAPDAASSVIVYTKDFWVGLTIDHLLRPNNSLLANSERMKMKESLFGGVTIIRKGRLLRPIDETVSIACLISNTSDNHQLDLGLYWAKSPLTFGVWYRGIPILNSERGDAFSILLGTKVQHYSFGYSYDFTVSNLIGHTSGTHEISFAYEFSHVKRKKLQAVPCPEF